MTGLYGRLRDLPLEVSGYGLEPMALKVGAGWTRRTTVIRLEGGGEEGVGEDITYDANNQAAFQEDGTALPLAGTFSLDGFSRRLAR